MEDFSQIFCSREFGISKSLLTKTMPSCRLMWDLSIMLGILSLMDKDRLESGCAIRMHNKVKLCFIHTVDSMFYLRYNNHGFN